MCDNLCQFMCRTLIEPISSVIEETFLTRVLGLDRIEHFLYLPGTNCLLIAFYLGLVKSPLIATGTKSQKLINLLHYVISGASGASMKNLHLKRTIDPIQGNFFAGPSQH